MANSYSARAFAQRANSALSRSAANNMGESALFPYLLAGSFTAGILLGVKSVFERMGEDAGRAADELDKMRYHPPGEGSAPEGPLTPPRAPPAPPTPQGTPYTPTGAQKVPTPRVPAPPPIPPTKARAAPAEVARGAPARVADVAAVIAGRTPISEIMPTLGLLRPADRGRSWKGTKAVQTEKGRVVNATPEEQQAIAYLQGQGADFGPGKGISPAIRAIVEEAADRYGIPRENLLGMVLYESGGNPNAVSGTGAVGLLQFTQRTASGYQLVNRFDPVANADAGARLYNDNGKDLKRRMKWDRDPTLIESYLAHQQGAAGAAAILKAYENPELGVSLEVQNNILSQGIKGLKGDDVAGYMKFTEKSFNDKLKRVSKSNIAEGYYPVAPGYQYDAKTDEATPVQAQAAQATKPAGASKAATPSAGTPTPPPVAEAKNPPSVLIPVKHPTLGTVLTNMFNFNRETP